MPRVVIACFMHETNTFSVQPTTQASFESGGSLWLTGTDIVAGVTGTNTETAGFLDVAMTEGWDVVGTIHGEAPPGGVVTDACFESYAAAILAPLKGGRCDGVLLALHGAMVTNTFDDAEGASLDQTLVGVGAEVRLTTILGYGIGLTTRLGYAASLTGGGIAIGDLDGFYATLGSSF